MMAMQRMLLMSLAMLIGCAGLSACGFSAPTIQKSTPLSSPNRALPAQIPAVPGRLQSDRTILLSAHVHGVIMTSIKGLREYVTVEERSGSHWKRIFQHAGFNGQTQNSTGTFQLSGISALMGKNAQQWVLNSWSAGADAGSSSITVWGMESGSVRPLLTLNDMGSMRVRVGHHLTVQGSYYANASVCMACGVMDTAVISWAAAAHKWHGTPKNFFQMLLDGPAVNVPPAHISAVATPSFQLGTGFDDSTFTLTGTGSSFSPGVLYSLYQSPAALGTSTLTYLETIAVGAGQQTVYSDTVTVNPEYSEVEKPIFAFSTGQYQLTLISGNHIVDSLNFSIALPVLPSPSPSPSANPPSSSPSFSPSASSISPAPSPSSHMPSPSNTPSQTSAPSSSSTSPSPSPSPSRSPSPSPSASPPPSAPSSPPSSFAPPS
jgi:hypothetical protein